MEQKARHHQCLFTNMGATLCTATRGEAHSGTLPRKKQCAIIQPAAPDPFCSMSGCAPVAAQISLATNRRQQQVHIYLDGHCDLQRHCSVRLGRRSFHTYFVRKCTDSIQSHYCIVTVYRSTDTHHKWWRTHTDQLMTCQQYLPQ